MKNKASYVCMSLRRYVYLYQSTIQKLNRILYAERYCKVKTVKHAKTTMHENKTKKTTHTTQHKRKIALKELVPAKQCKLAE